MIKVLKVSKCKQYDMKTMTTETCPKLREENSNSTALPCEMMDGASGAVEGMLPGRWTPSREKGEEAYSGEMKSLSRCIVQKKKD